MGPERHQRWSADAKQAVLESAFALGAIVVEAAREYEISTSQICKWHQEATEISAAPASVPALLVEEGPPPQHLLSKVQSLSSWPAAQGSASVRMIAIFYGVTDAARLTCAAR